MTIYSEIPLPELQSTSGIADIKIQSGKGPEYINEAIESNDDYQIGQNQMLLQVKEVDNYYIANALASQVLVSRITRPAGVFTVEEQINLLEIDLKGIGCDINA